MFGLALASLLAAQVALRSPVHRTDDLDPLLWLSRTLRGGERLSGTNKALLSRRNPDLVSVLCRATGIVDKF